MATSRSFIDVPPNHPGFSSSMDRRFIRSACAGIAARAATPCESIRRDREAILTMPPRGTLAEAKEFAQSHGGWIAARLGRLPKAAPSTTAAVIPLRGVAAPDRASRRPARYGVGRRRATAASVGLCVAGEPEYLDRRVHDFLKREARRDLRTASSGIRRTAWRQVKRFRSATNRAAGAPAPRPASLSFSWRLILAPPYVLDYLAAHEVAHLVEMNHSPRFWRVVERICPSSSVPRGGSTPKATSCIATGSRISGRIGQRLFDRHSALSWRVRAPGFLSETTCDPDRWDARGFADVRSGQSGTGYRRGAGDSILVFSRPAIRSVRTSFHGSSGSAARVIPSGHRA